MTTKDEALQMALEALEAKGDAWIVLERKAKTAIREALAEQPAHQEEPVATVYDPYDCNGLQWHCQHQPFTGTKLYTSPPQRKPWVGLTENEISRIYIAWDETPGASWADYARAIEAKLKEKNA